MDNVHHHDSSSLIVALSEPLAINAVELRRVREKVRNHIKETNAIVGLPIEPNAPPKGTKFAFVANVPPVPKEIRAIHEHWHRCSYCETSQKFAVDGKIVFCGDGKLRIIGPECWDKHFEQNDIELAREEYRDFERRERFSGLKNRYGPNARLLVFELRKAIATLSTSIDFVDHFPEILSQALPGLTDELHRALGDGILSVERLVEDIDDLEGARGQRALDRIGDKVKRKWKIFPIHRLMAGDALINKVYVAGNLAAAATSLGRAVEIYNSTSWETLTNKGFARKANEFETLCRDAATRINDSMRAMHRVKTFMSIPNLGGVVRWANDPDNFLATAGAYVLREKGLRWEVSEHEVHDVSLPAGFAVPEFKSLAELKDLLSVL